MEFGLKTVVHWTINKLVQDYFKYVHLKLTNKKYPKKMKICQYPILSQMYGTFNLAHIYKYVAKLNYRKFIQNIYSFTL